MAARYSPLRVRIANRQDGGLWWRVPVARWLPWTAAIVAGLVAWGVLAVVLGGCMIAGSLAPDPDDPGGGSGFGVTGDGPFCHARARILALPTSVDPGPHTIRTDVGCMNAVMTAAAFEGERPIARWRGEVYWTGVIADGPGDSGSEYRGSVADGSIRWHGHDIGPIRVGTDRYGRGGMSLSDWLPDAATGVVVWVQRGLGAGTGGHGATDVGHGTGPDRAVHGARPGHIATRPEGTVAHGRRTTRPDAGAPGIGTGYSGATGGIGTDTSPRSRGRTPRPGGVGGGHPAGRGEPGDAGLSMGMGVLGVIRVPASLAPALEVAALMADAGVRPATLAKQWLPRGLEHGNDRLRREIADEAAALAAREMHVLRARLAPLADYARLPATEQRRIVDAAGDVFQRAYFERVEHVAAAEITRLERSLAGGVDDAFPDRQKEGTERVVRHRRFGTFHKSKSDGLWWSTDKAGHGGSKWKVFEETPDGLRWKADADAYGNFITGKHKSSTGQLIPWSELGAVR